VIPYWILSNFTQLEWIGERGTEGGRRKEEEKEEEEEEEEENDEEDDEEEKEEEDIFGIFGIFKFATHTVLASISLFVSNHFLSPPSTDILETFPHNLALTPNEALLC